MSTILVLALTMSLFFTGPAQAASLVNTGQPAATTGGLPLNYPHTLFAQFTLTQPVIITGIQGWVNVTRGGSIIVQIYRDNGDVPGQFVNSQMAPAAGVGTYWVGATSLQWPLQPGTYWVGFMGTMMGSPDNLTGSMPGPSPSPLLKEGVIFIPGTDFVRNDGMDIGVIISGHPSSNPAAVNLLLLSND
jgi:hypothetical protein